MHQSTPSPSPSVASEPALELRRLRLADGAVTSLHIARFSRSRFSLRVRVLEPMETVLGWCERSGAQHAIVGGFYMRPGGPALGEVWINGKELGSEPIDPPWQGKRACVHVSGAAVTLAPRSELADSPGGDLLQAGPMLLAAGEPQIRDGDDPEGFSAGARQFDSDITVGRYPRSALGISDRELIAVVCDGRADDEAGLTLAELAAAMLELGAEDAINLDGGGSASLVVGGTLVNVPREEHGLRLVGGREVATLLHFAPLEGSGRSRYPGLGAK